jgi:hypothetical protein
VALLTAIVIWGFVNHSINDTKTLSNVPIRIINLQSDKTIQGLLPNGMLSRRITLTLTGSKDVINDLEPGDLEVLLDASTADTDDWVVHITKKNLVSLNPSLDLPQHIHQVESTDFVIKLSKLVTAKFIVTIQEPVGSPPSGYEYLDIWPMQFTQVVSGPEEEIQRFKEKKLTVTSFNLSDITKAELDAIKSLGHNDEISFPVPKKWKQVYIPFLNYRLEELNDPEAQNLRIDFLRKDFLPLAKEIPIRIFYPLDTLDKINPASVKLNFSDDIQTKEGILVLNKALYTREVSRLFIDVIRNSIEIVVVAAPENKRKVMAWYVDFINPRDLEDTYVAFSIANTTTSKATPGPIPKKREELLRRRFREYMHRLTLYLNNQKKLHVKSTLEDGQIKVVTY